MKIEVLIPSRGRAQLLQAVVVGMRAQESGKNEVRYTVLADADDHETQRCAVDISVALDVDEQKLLAVRENSLALKSDADAIMPWADDLFVHTPYWDEAVKVLTDPDGEYRLKAFSWQEVQDPGNHTAIVLTSQWVQAAGRMFPPYFPFWFADTWLKEVHGFAYRADMKICTDLRFFHARKATTNMHDLAFWFQVFADTRRERVSEAWKLCEAFGIEWRNPAALIAEYEKADAYQMKMVPRYEQGFGAGSMAKSEMYLKAKANAECLIRQKEAA